MTEPTTTSRPCPRWPAIARGGAWALVLTVVLGPVVCIGLAALGEDTSTMAPLGSARLLVLLAKSAAVALGATVAAFLIGGSVAAVVETRRVPARRLVRWLGLIPLAVPPFVHVVAWDHLVSGGVFTPGSGADGGFSLRQSPLVCMAFLGLAYSPLPFYFVSQGLRSLGSELVDAARLALRLPGTALRVVLPLTFPTLAVGLVLTFVLAFLHFEIPDLLEVTTYPVELTLSASAAGPARPLLLSAPVVGVTLGLLLAVHFWARSRGFALVGREAEGPLDRGGVGVLAWGLLLLWWSAGVLLPVGTLLAMCRRPSLLARALVESREHLLLGNSLPLAAAAIAVAAAAALARRRAPAWHLVLWLAFSLPPALLALGVIRLWNWPLLDVVYDSPFLLVLGLVARWFPLAYFLVVAYRGATRREYAESAALLGGGARGRLRRWWRVNGPLSAPVVGLAVTVVFVLGSGELPMALILQHPGAAPVTVRIYSLLHAYRDDEVAALILLHLGVVLAVVALVLAVARWWGKR